jgi:hypothetical protein
MLDYTVGCAGATLEANRNPIPERTMIYPTLIRTGDTFQNLENKALLVVITCTAFSFIPFRSRTGSSLP